MSICRSIFFLNSRITHRSSTLHEHYFFRTALIKTSQCQRDNSRRQSTQIKDVFDFPSNDEDSSSTDDGPFAANQPQAKKRRLLKSNERRIRPSTERKGSPMPLETSTVSVYESLLITQSANDVFKAHQWSERVQQELPVYVKFQ